MYEWLKAVHLIAVVTVIAGMIAAALALRGLATSGAQDRGMARAVLSFDRIVTGPALALAWIAGFTLAADAGFLTEGWLLAKIGFVLTLSALHGMLGAALRRTVEGDGAPVRPFLRQPWPVLALAACIIFLVVLKPSA